MTGPPCAQAPGRARADVGGAVPGGAQGLQVPVYRHTTVKRRGMYTFTSNPLEGEKKGGRAREKSRGQCGWSSVREQPYRPLGSPDLERVKAAIFKRENVCAVETMAAGDDLGAKEEGFSLEDDEPQENTLSSGNGFSDLRREIKRSFDRMTACRTGVSFMDIVDRQVDCDEGPASPSGRGSPRRPPPLRLPQIDGVGSPTSTAPKQTSPGVREYVVSKTSKKKIQFDKSMITGPEFLADIVLDPAVTLQERLQEFKSLRASLNKRLNVSLRSLEVDREEAYKRKFMTFKIRNTGFNGERWRLEAEKSHLEAQLHAIDSNQWYSRFLQMVQEKMRVTPLERQVIEAVKGVVDSGGDFEASNFYVMVLGLPLEAHTNMGAQKILNFLRDELKIGVEDYKTFLTAQSLPISHSLRVGPGQTPRRDPLSARKKQGGGMVSPEVGAKTPR